MDWGRVASPIGEDKMEQEIDRPIGAVFGVLRMLKQSVWVKRELN